MPQKSERSQVDKLADTFILGEDFVNTLRMKYPWVERAVSSGLRYEDPETGESKSVFTRTSEVDGQHIVYPTVRRKRDESGNPLDELFDVSVCYPRQETEIAKGLTIQIALYFHYSVN